MSKLNEKPLSQMLEEIDYVSARTKIMSEMLDNPDDCGIYPTTIAYQKLDAEFNKLRSVAIELAKWIEEETSCNRLSFRHVRPCSRCDATSRAKDILGGGE